MTAPILLAGELAEDIGDLLLELSRNAVIPPIRAANLLRRLNDAIRHSRPATPKPPAAAGSGG
jgi:hypothetical protein